MYKRKTNSKISFDIYRISDDTLASHFEKELEIDEIVYKTEKEAINLDGTLTEWADNVSKFKALEIATIEIGSEMPDDLETTTLYGATFKAENIEGYGLNPEETKEEIPITEIPVTIDKEPILITIKHDLSTMDIIQISRLQKSISNLEKTRQEYQEQMSLYDERIRVGYDIAASIRQRNEWLNKVNITNIKIKRQQEAIEKIKSGI